MNRVRFITFRVGRNTAVYDVSHHRTICYYVEKLGALQNASERNATFQTVSQQRH